MIKKHKLVENFRIGFGRQESFKRSSNKVYLAAAGRITDPLRSMTVFSAGDGFHFRVLMGVAGFWE